MAVRASQTWGGQSIDVGLAEDDTRKSPTGLDFDGDSRHPRPNRS